MKRLIFCLLFLSCGAPPREKAYKILTDGLKDHSRIVNITAALTLAKLNDTLALKKLNDFTKNNDEEVIASAIIALGKLKKTNSIDRLTELAIKNESPLIRTEAYKALALYQNRSLAPIFERGLDDRIGKIRAISARALADLGLKEFKNKISKLLNSPDPNVRLAGAEALGLMGDPKMVNIIKQEMAKSAQTDFQIWPTAIISLANLQDTSSLTSIKDYTLDAQLPWEIRLSAVEALLIFGDQSGREVLSAALKSNDVYVRTQAMDIILRRGDATFLEDVRPLINDPYTNVAIPAIQYCSKWAGHNFLTDLINLLNHRNTYIQLAAAEEVLKRIK